MRKRVLITGGNGFVGRHFARALDRHHELTVVDTLRYGQTSICSELSHTRVIVADVCDRNLIRRVFDEVRPDIVVHLAAIHYIPECEALPTETVATNVGGTVSVLDACQEGVRLVFVSSMAVYRPSLEPHVEDVSPLGPSDIYGFSKLHAEQYVLYLARTKRLSATIVRLTNVIGPGETSPHVIPAILGQVLAGRRSIQLGSVESRRDYIDVRDVAEALSRICLCQTPQQTADVVNVATGRSHSVREVVQRISLLSGCALDIVLDPGRLRPVDRPSLVADIQKTAATYGWRAAYDLDRTLRTLIEEPEMLAPLLGGQ